MSEVVTGDAVVVEVRVAQMPSRALAIIIDLAVQLTVLVGAYAILGAFAIISDSAMLAAVMLLLVVLVMVGYPVLFESLSRGRSLGKLALGLRVVSDDGSPERFRQALFRGLAGVLEFWLLSGAPALISSLVSQRGKRLGDVFAGTIVISDRGPRDSGQAIVMPPPLAAWAATLELSQLPNEVVQAARQYLSRWHDLSPQVQHEMGVRIATQTAAFVSPAAPPGVPPHAYLSAVLAERRRREEARLAQRAGATAANGLPQAGPYQTGQPSPYQAAQPSPYQTGQPSPYQTGPYQAAQPGGPYQGTQPAPQSGPYGQPGPYAQPRPPAPAPEPPKATPGGFAPPQ
ncbi:RDD family protein [Nonomuraea turkmeniaca]|uniref:RDD family protein n=1 Tax=Nonomuraea turkmeniaca TaxID=103838 RepID=A0A5S4EWD7_9ACTN|nr:RDD family protein [Nonomuraea turkmeniaca]TMR07894.1 RDD family protein [Nonomuraea turkmeniaca]